MDTWILVADRARARLFTCPGDALSRLDGPTPPAELMEIGDFADPEARMPARELESDRPPTTHDRFGHGRHAIEPHTPAADKATHHFAAALCEVLEHGQVDGRFDQLVLVAPPRFLGALNAAMNPNLRRSVVGELPKDLVGSDAATLLQAVAREGVRRPR